MNGPEGIPNSRKQPGVWRGELSPSQHRLNRDPKWKLSEPGQPARGVLNAWVTGVMLKERYSVLEEIIGQIPDPSCKFLTRNWFVTCREATSETLMLFFF